MTRSHATEEADDGRGYASPREMPAPPNFFEMAGPGFEPWVFFTLDRKVSLMNLDWKFFERTESIAVLALSLFSYFSILNGSGLIFLVLILLPDISMVGYLKDEELGALLYNIFHNYLLPAILLSYGITLNEVSVQQISLIWIAHIAGDRILGYGLKTEEGFKYTHLKNL